MILLLQRVGFLLVVIWLAATIAFFMLRVLPGDAIQAQLAQGGVDPAVIEARRAEQGLTDPVGIQYLRFISGILRGDLGYSLLSREPVTDMVARNILPTGTLAFGALILASLLGISLGILGALRVGRGVSFLAELPMSLSLSIPIYYTGTLAIYVFSVLLGWLPSAGASSLNHLILPVSVLGFHTAGSIARVTQGNVREILNADFVQVARAKGLRERIVIARHILRPALLPVIQVIALQAGFLLSGAVITESLFVRPGIGRLLLDATLQQDYPLVQGIVVLSAVMYAVLNTLADIARSLLDPRLRLS
jgi:ABC-type dipeptide/oligopeptide/nickel transport system permease component